MKKEEKSENNLWLKEKKLERTNSSYQNPFLFKRGFRGIF